MSDEELESDDNDSVDSFCVVEVLQMVLDDEDMHARLCYLCRTEQGVEEIFDRSDLMDDGEQQKGQPHKLHPRAGPLGELFDFVPASPPLGILWF